MVTFDEEQVAHMRALFSYCDKDGSGTIDADELGSVMHELGKDLSQKELDDLMKQLDTDGNGSVDFEEFLHGMSKWFFPSPEDDGEDAEVDENASEKNDKDSGSEKENEAEDVDSETKEKEEEGVSEYYEQARAVFDHVDKDGSGTIEVEELKEVLKEMGKEPSAQEVKRMMDNLGVGEDEVITFDIFLAGFGKFVSATSEDDGPHMSEEQIAQYREIFKLFDQDGSGTIDIQEMRKVLHELGKKVEEKELEKLMGELDGDGSGEIDFDEFLMGMERLDRLTAAPTEFQSEEANDKGPSMKDFEQMQAKVVSLKKQLRMVEQKCVTLKNEATYFETESARRAEELQKRTNELSAIKKDYKTSKELREVNKELTQEIEQLRNQLAKAKELESSLIKRQRTLSTSFNAEKATLDTTKEQLQAKDEELTKLRSLVKNLSSKNLDVTPEVSKNKKYLEEELELLQQKVNTEIPQLQDSNKKLLEQSREYKVLLAESRSKISSLEQQLEDAQSMLLQQNNSVMASQSVNNESLGESLGGELKAREAEEELDKLKKEQAKLKDEFSKLYESEKVLKSELEKLQNTHSQLSSEHQKLQSSHSSLNDEAEKLKEGASKYQSDFTKLQNENSELQALHQKLSSEYALVTSEKAKLEEEKKALSESENNLKREFGSLQGDHTKLKSEHDQLQKEKSYLQTQNTQLKESNTKLQGNYQNLQTENSKLQLDHHELQNSNTQLQTEHTQLQKSKTELETQHTQLKESNTKLQNDYQNLQTENNKLHTSHTQLQTEHEKLQTENSKLTNEHTQLKETNIKLQHEHEHLKIEKSELSNQHSQLKETNTKLQTDFEKLQSDNTKLTTEHAQLQQTAQKLQSEHQTLALEKQKLEETSTNSKAEVEKIQEEKIQISNQFAQLQSELLAFKEQLAKEVEEKNELKKNLAQSEEEVARYIKIKSELDSKITAQMFQLYTTKSLLQKERNAKSESEKLQLELLEKNKQLANELELEGVSSFSSQELLTEDQLSIISFINDSMKDDPQVSNKVPIGGNHGDCGNALVDGVIMCKLLNKAVPGTIDERVLKLRPKKKNDLVQNHNLCLNSGMAIGCSLPASMSLGLSQSLLQGQVTPVLDYCFEILRVGMASKVDLGHCKELIQLKEGSENAKQFRVLPVETILLRWLNYHLKKEGLPATNNFEDKDCTRYVALLHQLFPEVCDKDALLQEKDVEKRAQMIISNVLPKAKCPVLLSTKMLLSGDPKISFVQLGLLFAVKHGLEALKESESKQIQQEILVEFDAEGSREERAFCFWMQSLGVMCKSLVDDVQDGLVILQVFDKIQPNIVDWKQVMTNKQKMNQFNKTENCNYAVKTARKLGFSTVGIAGKDFVDGNRKLIMALVWQAMRHHIFSILQQLKFGGREVSEEDMVSWANKKVSSAGKVTSISDFRDKSLSTGLFLIDLLSSLDPEMVDYELVTAGDTPDNKMLNAKYSINTARKMGCCVFLLWEDIVEVKSKMILTMVASLMAVADD